MLVEIDIDAQSICIHVLQLTSRFEHCVDHTVSLIDNALFSMTPGLVVLPRRTGMRSPLLRLARTYSIAVEACLTRKSLSLSLHSLSPPLLSLSLSLSLSVCLSFT